MFGLYRESYVYILINVDHNLPIRFTNQKGQSSMNTLIKYFRRGSMLFFAVLISTSALAAGLITSGPQRASAASVARPAAVGGAGATLPYTEIQAENATYTGTLIDATQNRTYPGLAVEAIERRAVTLTGSQYVEFTVPVSSNSIVVRYSIPDGNGGAGIDATLGLTINGVAQTALATTSRYGYAYGGYPFNNNMGDVRPHHFYDEVHRLVGQMSAGQKVRLTGTGTTTTVDLIDFEQVGAALSQPANSISLTSYAGVDPSGSGDSTTATQQAINDASSQGKVLWVPSGTYKINTQLHVNNVTIQGAGMWYSTFHFITQTGNSEGFYGNYAPTPSTNVHLSNFAIFGEVVVRNDNDQINGIGGSLTNSTVDHLWIEHTKCGLWLDGPFDNLQISYMRIRNQNADGVNFHKGVTHSSVTQSVFRNTGDDALAMWSDSNGTSIADANNSFTFNRVEIPVLANGIALYGGTNNTVTDNYIADQQAEGGGIHVGNRFSPVTAVAGTINILRNTIARSGSEDYYNGWNFGTGALWFYALDQALNATINVNDNLILDSNYEAIHFIGSSITGITFNNNQIVGTGTYAIENRANGGGVTFTNTTATGLGTGSYFNCTGTAFVITMGTGNSGWNNTSTCISPYPTPVYGPVATVTPQATFTSTNTNTPCPGGTCPTNTPTFTPSRTPTNTATPSPIPGTVVKAINAGGAATGNWVADTNFDVGNQYSDTSTAIDTSGWLDTNIAPQAVYQTVRWNANFTYTIPGLTAGQPYVVLLHFAELSFQAAGSRKFNVAINGTSVLSAFDVFAAAGFKHAIGKAFNATANGSGQIVIAFTQGGADNPMISGIEIIQQSGSTAVPTNTPTRTPTVTNTPVGPTNTPTRTPTVTNTSVGPTNTPTRTPTRTNTPTSGQSAYPSGVAWAIPGTIQAENFDLGGETVAYHDVETTNQGGQYRTGDGVDIEATTDTGGGYNVGWTRTDEWLEYTVNVATTGNYTLTERVASAATTGSFRVEFNGVNKSGTVTVPNTGGWQTWTNLSQTVSLSAGQQVMRIYWQGNDTNLNYVSLSAAGGGTNLALGKPIAESGHTQTYVATNANDGNLTTYWEGAAYPALLTVDLGSAQSISSVKVKLNPDTAWGARTQTFAVLGSTDNVNFNTTLKASASYGFDPATGNVVTITFTSASVRYVRLSFTANTGAPSGQVAEFEIYQ